MISKESFANVFATEMEKTGIPSIPIMDKDHNWYIHFTDIPEKSFISVDDYYGKYYYRDEPFFIISSSVKKRLEKKNWDMDLKEFIEKNGERFYEICTNKKANAEFWDEIDDYIVQSISNIAEGCSLTDIKNVEDKIYEDGLQAEIRDLIIDFLEGHGGIFPFIDEDF